MPRTSRRAGTATATGDALEFTQVTNLSAAGTAYHIADAPGSILWFDSTVGTFTFQPTANFDGSLLWSGHGVFDQNALANFHGIVNNFVVR